MAEIYYIISTQRQDNKPYRVVRVWNGKYRTIIAFYSKVEAEQFRQLLPTSRHKEKTTNGID